VYAWKCLVSPQKVQLKSRDNATQLEASGEVQGVGGKDHAGKGSCGFLLACDFPGFRKLAGV